MEFLGKEIPGLICLWFFLFSLWLFSVLLYRLTARDKLSFHIRALSSSASRISLFPRAQPPSVRGSKGRAGILS